MALFACPECQHLISDQADFCPNCGYVLQKSSIPLPPPLPKVQTIQPPRITILPPPKVSKGCKPKTQNILSLFIVLGVVVFMFWIFGGNSNNDISKSNISPLIEQETVIDSAELLREQKKRDSLSIIREQELEKGRIAWEKSKAGQIQKKYPTWSKEDCELVANKKFWIGMHYDMLVYIAGPPDSSNPSNYGSGVQWQWCWWDKTPSCFYAEADKIITSYN